MGMIWFCLCFLALYSSIICVNKTEEKHSPEFEEFEE